MNRSSQILVVIRLIVIHNRSISTAIIQYSKTIGKYIGKIYVTDQTIFSAYNNFHIRFIFMNRFENRCTISQRFHIRHIQIIFVQNVFSHYQATVCIPFFFHRHTIHIAIHISNFENIFTQSCFHINAILVNQIRHIQYLTAVYIGTHVIIHYGDQIQFFRTG